MEVERQQVPLVRGQSEPGHGAPSQETAFPGSKTGKGNVQYPAVINPTNSHSNHAGANGGGPNQGTNSST